MSIHIKTESELASMRLAGKKLAEVMRALEKEIRPGVSTLQLDQLAEKLILERGGRPAFKGYGGGKNPFPASICASINNEIVHGIPSDEKILQAGDVFKVDMGLEIEGFCSDMARTFAVGQISPEAQKLIETTQQAFWQGIKRLKAGKMLSDYSKVAEKTVIKEGFSVVRNLVGHGIGRDLHEDPQVPNFFEKNFRDVQLQAGMTLALEPMVNAGDFKTVLGKDGWVFETADGSLSAHYENTILITKNGVEILTQ